VLTLYVQRAFQSIFHVHNFFVICLSFTMRDITFCNKFPLLSKTTAVSKHGVVTYMSSIVKYSRYNN